MNKIEDRLRDLEAANTPVGRLLDWLRIAVEIERKSRSVPDRVEVGGIDGAPIPVTLRVQETLEKICEFCTWTRSWRSRRSGTPGSSSISIRPASCERGSELGHLRTSGSMHK